MHGPSAIGNGTEVTLTLETFSQNITALSDLSLGWWRAGLGEGWRSVERTRKTFQSGVSVPSLPLKVS